MSVNGRRALLSVLLIAAAGLWAYRTSAAVPFLFDDEPAIVTNPHVRHLWPVWDAVAAPPGDTTVAGRPILSLSFALNYAVGGLHAWGYHAANVLIHLLTALLLFGIVRRTLVSSRDAPVAPWLALAVSLLWVVHPLTTQAVTYVSQRAESLMGLWYLLTLYGAIRGWEGPHPARWHAAAIASCALGMGTKEVMASAPIIVLLHERAFVGGSVRECLRRRRWFYAGLATTWLLLAVLIAASPRMGSTGLGNPRLPGPFRYGLTQCGVILHYLRLALWPRPLVFDYGWPAAVPSPALLPSVLLIGALIALTAWGLWRRHPLGFLGAWIVLILAPTSSLLPIKDAAFEHRMYLPLMAVITLLVVAAELLIRRLASLTRQRVVAMGLAACAVIGLGTATIVRQHAYRSALALWRDTVAKRPMNARAHNNLGVALSRAGRFDDAATHWFTSLALDPTQADAHYNLGRLYAQQGRFAAAVPQFRQAVRLRPNDWEAYRRLREAETRGGMPTAFAQRSE